MTIRELPDAMITEGLLRFFSHEDEANEPMVWTHQAVENAIVEALLKAWKRGFNAGRYPLSGPQNDEPTREELLFIEISQP